MATTAEQLPAWRRPWIGGDGARGIGALMVFMAHIAFAEGTYAGLQWTGLPGRDAVSIFGGEVGLHAAFSPARLVNLFFAFSAYLLARPFIAWALDRNRQPGTRNFYIRRVLRIVPGYWALCVLVVLWLVVLKGGSFDLGHSLKTLLLVDGGWNKSASGSFSWMAPLAVTWTVRVEALGYLVLPLLGWLWFLIGRRWGMRGLAVSLAGLAVLTFFLRFHFLASFPLPLLDGPAVMQWLFLPGLAVALIEAHDPLQRRIAGWRRGPTLLMALIGFLLLIGSEPAGQAVIQHHVSANGPLPTDDIPRAFGILVDATRAGTWLALPMQVAGAALLLLGLLGVEWQGGRPPLRLDGKVARWVGLRSYSFYLVHFPVLGLLLPHVAPDEKGWLGYVALGAVALPVSLLAAALMYRFVEVPGMELAKRLTARRPGPLGADPAAAAALDAHRPPPPPDAGEDDRAAAAAAVAAAATPAPVAPEGSVTHTSVAPGVAPPLVPVAADAPDEVRSLRQRMRFFEGGDPLRGWMLLAVIVWHTAGWAVSVRHPAPEPDFGQYGTTIGAALQATQISVWVFFALSAYLLSRPFVAAAFGQARGFPDPGRYVRHRIGRVVPAMWAVMVIALVMYGTLGSSTGDIVAMFGFSQVWQPAAVNGAVGHAWSMDVEAVFYVALPLVGWLCWSAMRRWKGIGGWLAVAILLVVAVVATVLCSTWLPAETPPMHSPIGALVAFLPGVAFAVLEIRLGTRIARWRHTPAIGVATTLLGLLVAYKLSSWTRLGSAEAIFYNAASAGLIVGGVVLWQLSGRRTWAILRWRPVVWLGERSYSIFMIHGIAIFELRSLGVDASSLWGHFLLYFAGGAAFAIVLGVILHHLIERPLTRLSRGERPIWGGAPSTVRSPFGDPSPTREAPVPPARERALPADA